LVGAIDYGDQQITIAVSKNLTQRKLAYGFLRTVRHYY
jgi:hypothetical protein